MQVDVFAEGAAQQLLDVADDGVEVEHLWPGDLAAAEGEQLVGQLGGAFAGALDWSRSWRGCRPAPPGPGGGCVEGPRRRRSV